MCACDCRLSFLEEAAFSLYTKGWMRGERTVHLRKSVVFSVEELCKEKSDKKTKSQKSVANFSLWVLWGDSSDTEFKFGMECVLGESEDGLFSGREGNYSRRREWYFFLCQRQSVDERREPRLAARGRAPTPVLSCRWEKVFEQFCLSIKTKGNAFAKEQFDCDVIISDLKICVWIEITEVLLSWIWVAWNEDVWMLFVNGI